MVIWGISFMLLVWFSMILLNRTLHSKPENIIRGEWRSTVKQSNFNFFKIFLHFTVNLFWNYMVSFPMSKTYCSLWAELLHINIFQHIININIYTNTHITIFFIIASSIVFRFVFKLSLSVYFPSPVHHHFPFFVNCQHHHLPLLSPRFTCLHSAIIPLHLHTIRVSSPQASYPGLSTNALH